MKTDLKNQTHGRRIGFSVVVFGFLLAAYVQPGTTETPLSDRADRIENAMFSRSLFFGAEAFVPRPTGEVYQNLSRLLTEFPDDAVLLEHLAASEEKLGLFADAEKTRLRLSEVDRRKANDLAAFYHRRARWLDEADVIAKKVLPGSKSDEKAGDVERLLDLARRHELTAYLQPPFYRQIIAENPNVFEVFEKIFDRQVEEESYSEALELLRGVREQFPAHSDALLEKEVSVLVKINKIDEAERLYRMAFDPFWSSESADKFYEFLNDHDRLREYGSELKTRFAKDASDFQNAIRLADYRKYRGDDIISVIVKLRQAKKVWSTEELVTVSRLLIQNNEGEPASRFLYALYLRDDFKEDPSLKAKVLYQLFELFSDAEYQRLPLTAGDLRFYQEIANVDTDPGIMTGILSLIFSDTNPGGQLRDQEFTANKYFNRAAAYRIFLLYKQEAPASPELTQMYLDIIRLYTATGETGIAEATLREFAERYGDSTDYPPAALKLADAYTAMGDLARERAICREIMDHLGKNGPPQGATPSTSYGELSTARNAGITIPILPNRARPTADVFEANGQFTDYLRREAPPVTYPEVLEKLISSLAKEKKTAEILEVYSGEVRKYPQAEWLYEQHLKWLEQTNLTEDQLAVYRQALDRFQSDTWSSKLARWLVRENRQAEFAELSTGLVARLSDTDVQAYLAQMVDANVSGAEFQKQLYLQLYLDAHRRFPHNTVFVTGLMRFYRAQGQAGEWRKLAATYFFVSPEIRKMFLDDLAEKGELRTYLANAGADDSLHSLFRADGAIRLSRFEEAVDAYRQLNQAYPHSPEFEEPLLALTRSVGQKNAGLLNEAAGIANLQTEFSPGLDTVLTRSGEILAESGDYPRANDTWGKLISTATGERKTYLDTATVYWDYFQYDHALETIRRMREHFSNGDLNAFEAGVILEDLHRPSDAIREYIKALAGRDDESQTEKATRRLAKLSLENKARVQIDSAFAAERTRRPDPSSLSLGFARYLIAAKRKQEAARVLGRAAVQNRDYRFLESALEFLGEADDPTGEQLVLKRLADISASPRRTIKYRLRLARSFESDHKRAESRNVLTALVRRFPANYGVVTEASDFFHRLGYDNEAVTVLRDAVERSRGGYKNQLAAKLSRRLVKLDRLDEAERILNLLHDKNAADIDLFRELANIYVKKAKPDDLRRAFDKTLSSLRKSDADPRELDDRVTDLRTQMVDAFTHLRDHASAIEQHIEIINRAAEKDEAVNAAIRYVKRYGGGDALLAYYKKTSVQAFKNYRWKVVLAKIYEANGDPGNALSNYKAAITDQPEMIDLYLASADLLTRIGNFDDALKDLAVVLDLTNDDSTYIKKKIEVLKKAGRTGEARTEEAKLPAAQPIVKTDAFRAARDLGNTDGQNALRLYREAFDALFADPLTGELTTADIVGYVRAARAEEPINVISGRLWDLRRKLIDIADQTGSTMAGEARKRITTVDQGITSSVGEIAASVATDDELAALHEDLKQRIDTVHVRVDTHQTLSEIQDISRRARFGDLEEMILIKRLDDAPAIDRQSRLRSLLDFYRERGAYEKALSAMERYDSDDLSGRAEAARLVGDGDKELVSLRALYAAPRAKSDTTLDADVSRYLELLYKNDRKELASLTLRSSVHQIRLINFLLGKGEAELAGDAIRNADLPDVWKRSRLAEVTLALKQFAPSSPCRFCDAMRLAPIGEMLQQTPDKEQFPTGDDWFRMGRQYGEWLYRSPKPDAKPSAYLTAMTENRPHSASEQTKLGSFYLENNLWYAALDHFRLAVELAPTDPLALADLGAAQYLTGKKEAADTTWKAFRQSAMADLNVFFRELEKYGLAAEAARRIAPEIVIYLKDHDADDSEDLMTLVGLIAASFKDPAQRALYFKGILDQRPTDTPLAELLINESLIDNAGTDVFYERLIGANALLAGYEQDFAFRSVVERTWSREDAEAVYDQETEYDVPEPENDRYDWQKRYLEVLLARKENDKAAASIMQLERELQGKFARPAWLRLAHFRLRARRVGPDLVELERFVGISVSDQVRELKPPSLERLNEVLQMLREEGRRPEAGELGLSFYARMLAMNRYESLNFIGLARVSFEQGDAALGAGVLRLMIDMGGDSSKEMAMAAIANLEIVSRHAVDPARLAETGTSNFESQEIMLDQAARVLAEFGQTDGAIDLRRALYGLNPAAGANRLELAALLSARGRRPEAVDLLGALANDRDAARTSRWQAKWQLSRLGENADFPDLAYDPFSQFYQARLADDTVQQCRYLAASLIAGADEALPALQDLIKCYALAGQPYAALKLAATDKGEKSDELLSLLSAAAESTGDFAGAIEFEQKVTNGGDAVRIRDLMQKAEAAGRRATDLVIDTGNTRNL